MQNIYTQNRQNKIALALIAASIILLIWPHKTVNAEVISNNQRYTVNLFNYFWGANKNDPNYSTYAKTGQLNDRISGNYAVPVQVAKVSNQKVVYWDRPVSFYGVPPSPTHGASAVTPTPPGTGGIYVTDMAPAGGPVFVSGANYGNGRPVGRVIDPNAAHAIVPGGYPQ
jgi:hypothetical protein